MWEIELKLIESLGKLYPKFNGNIFEYKYYQHNNFEKVRWVYYLCAFQLKRRIPRLEEFLKDNNKYVWDEYRHHFNIKE